MNKKLFFFISVFIFSFIFVWESFLYRRFLALNSSFNYSAEIVSLDDFYDPELKKFKGETNSVTDFSFTVVGETNDTVSIQNVFDVKTSYGEKIFSVSRIYGIDKITQQHVASGGDKQREGYLFAPRNLKKGEPFVYWHVNYDAPAQMRFVKEEYVNDLLVYRYESDYSGEEIDQSDNLTDLPGVPEERGIRLLPHLTIWVEPTTGWLVHYKDQTQAFFYDKKTDEIREPWNSFRNFYTEDSISRQASMAKNLKFNMQLLRYGVPFLLVIFWFMSFLALNFGKKASTSLLIKSLIFITVSILLILLTFGAWWYTRIQSQQIYNSAVETAKQDVQKRISERMRIYANALGGTRALFTASEEVTRDEWRSYIESIDLVQRYPGIQGLAYAEVITKDEITDLEKKVRAEGYPQFSVYPLGEREYYSSIIYIEPFDERNQRAFGFDMFSEEVRKRALLIAAETNQPTLSGKVTLVQEFETEVQPGTLMYLPFFVEGDLQGYVYFIYRMYDLLGEMFSSEDLQYLGFRIFDAAKSDEVTQENILFDSNILSQSPINGVNEHRPLGRSTVYLYNTRWIIEFFATEDSPLFFENTIVSRMILIFGFSVTILLFIFFIALLVSQYNNQANMSQMSQTFEIEKNRLNDLNQRLQHDQSYFIDAQKLANIGCFEYDLIAGKKKWSAQMFPIVEHEEDSEPIKLENFIDLVVPEYKKQFNQFFVKILKSKNAVKFKFPIMSRKSQIKWIDCKVITYFENDKPVRVIGIMQDITENEQVELSHNELINYVLKQIKVPLERMRKTLGDILIENTDNLNVHQLESLGSVEKLSEKMLETNAILTNILNIEHGTLSLNLKLFHPKDLLTLIVKKFDREIQQKHLKLMAEISPDISPMVSDSQFLGDVISVILSNSIKYTPHLGAINLKLSADYEDITFVISDTGYGVMEEEKPHLFERYFRGSNILKYEPFGTGLSLFYAKKMTEFLGGKIFIDTHPNKGTTVTIKVPKRIN